MLESASVEEDVMTPLERSISERALIFAKANRTRIARELACLTKYPGENYPVSVFMAGSPGAGKTEVSKSFIRLMEEGGSSALRIDPDDFREYFPDYTGANSSLFQRGVTAMVERTVDLVYQQRRLSTSTRSLSWRGNLYWHGRLLRGETFLAKSSFASFMHQKRRCAD